MKHRQRILLALLFLVYFTIGGDKVSQLLTDSGVVAGSAAFLNPSSSEANLINLPPDIKLI